MIGQKNHVAITISKNDDANGVLEFEQPSINVTEEHSGGVLNVTRTKGSFGEVSSYCSYCIFLKPQKTTELFPAEIDVF